MLYLEYENLPDQYQLMFFPAGEPHAKIPVIDGYEVFVRASITSWEDFGQLLVLLNAIKSQDKYIYLFLPYFPGARQDRNPGGQTPLTVDMYAKILQPYVDMLITFDIHSPEAVHYISRHFGQTRFHQSFEFSKGLFPDDIVGVIAPDKGAVQRARSMALKHFPNAELYVCDKKRDFNTGHITGYEMPELTAPGRYIVIDDICDGGWTFNELAETFCQNAVAKDSELWLYVSHGIFSKGLDNISPQYTKIITTDSIWRYDDGNDNSRLRVLGLDFITACYIQTAVGALHMNPR